MVQTSDWISYRSTCDYSPFGIFLQQQYLILYDETISSADSRQKKKKKSLLSLCHRVTHANQNTRRKHTRRGRQRDNWGIVGSRHVTGCVYKCVSQTLFLDEHINSRPSLPRHRLATNSHLWRSHLSFLKPYTKLKTVYSFSFHQNASPNALATPCWQSKSSWQQIGNLPVPVYLYLLTEPMSSPVTALQTLMHN